MSISIERVSVLVLHSAFAAAEVRAGLAPGRHRQALVAKLQDLEVGELAEVLALSELGAGRFETVAEARRRATERLSGNKASARVGVVAFLAARRRLAEMLAAGVLLAAKPAATSPGNDST